MSIDSDQARAAIMQRIRTNQRRSEADAAARAGAADYLARHPAGPRPSAPSDRLQHFIAMAERMASSVATVASSAEAPAAIAQYLREHGLASRAVAWPTLAALPWAAAGIEVEFRPPRRDESAGADLVGITGCFCALAETGTLVLLSGPESYASTHLLPETHVALVVASRIEAGMEDAFARMRAERGGAEAMMPRAVNMVSGPSRTGDIEQTIVLGAHGPYRVHIVVATDE